MVQPQPYDVNAAMAAFNAAPTMAGAGLPPGLPGLQRSMGGGVNPFPWGYWRAANGWIVLGQYGPFEFMRQTRKGLTPLGANNGYRDQEVQFLLNTPEYQPNNYRLGGKYAKLLQAGGAKEFPVDQIVELGWHVEPPLIQAASGQWVPVVFHQMEGVEVFQYECGVCGKKSYALTNAEAKKKLRAHESIVHKETSSQSELARLLTEATAGQTTPLNERMIEVVNILAKGQESLAAQVQATQAQFQQQMAAQQEQFFAFMKLFAPANAEADASPPAAPEPAPAKRGGHTS